MEALKTLVVYGFWALVVGAAAYAALLATEMLLDAIDRNKLP